MILADVDIQQSLSNKSIIINPIPPRDHFAPSALDLRVGYEFRRWKQSPPGVDVVFDCSHLSLSHYGDMVEQIEPSEDGCITLRSNDFILARTLEMIELPLSSRIAARVEGRSSLARMGLAVHITAPTIHAGFQGPIVLEMKNHGPFTLKLTPGITPVCQLIFEQVSQEPGGPLISDFQSQDSVLGKTKETDQES